MTELEERALIEGRLMPYPKFLNVIEQPELGMFLLFISIIILCVAVYKMGFAIKLGIGKNIIIYTFLILGSTILTFLALFLPIVEGLLVALLILVLYKIRLRKEKAEGKFSN